jgi:hypothetical protein
MYRNKPNNNESTTQLHRGPSIDASYQVSDHLAEGLQRRRLQCEKLTDVQDKKFLVFYLLPVCLLFHNVQAYHLLSVFP